jgi:hypothetical protein
MSLLYRRSRFPPVDDVQTSFFTILWYTDLHLFFMLMMLYTRARRVLPGPGPGPARVWVGSGYRNLEFSGFGSGPGMTKICKSGLQWKNSWYS